MDKIEFKKETTKLLNSLAEVILNNDDLLEELIDKCGKIKVTPEPQFKVGDWVKIIDYHSKEDLNFPLCKISGINMGAGGTYSLVLADNTPYGGASYVRLTTKEEIESHLRKIADEKYIGKKARCLDFDDDISRIDKFDRYEHIEDGMFVDRLIYWSDDIERCMVVYSQGKWAEILPEKKKLPETKDEFIRFMHDWHNRPNYTSDYKFLEDYED